MPRVIYGDRNRLADGEQVLRKVTVPEKFIRLAIVGALCVNVYGCGVSTGRDLTLAGAVQRFDDRRAAVRAEQAVLEGVDTKRAAQLKPLPPRRELLQVRVPAIIEVDDIADDVVAASISDMTGLGVDLSVGSRGNGQLLSGKRSLESQIKALDKRSETIRRQRRSVLFKYNMEKLLLDQMDMRHSKSRDLTLQGFKIANEKMLQGFIADLEQQYAEAEPTTIIGLTCLLYTSPSPRDPKTSRMPSSA